MYELAKVKSIDGITATVVIPRKGGCCDSCEKETCDIPATGIETEAINEAGAEVGQKVKIVMKPFTFVKGAVLLYILPVFSLIGGAIIGKIYLPDYISGIDSELLAALAGFVSFFLSIFIVKIISGKMNNKTEYKSVIESIMEG